MQQPPFVSRQRPDRRPGIEKKRTAMTEDHLHTQYVLLAVFAALVLSACTAARQSIDDVRRQSPTTPAGRSPRLRVGSRLRQHDPVRHLPRRVSVHHGTWNNVGQRQ